MSKQLVQILETGVNASRTFFSNLNRVAGKGGIFQRLNHSHIEALQRLHDNSGDVSVIQRVNTIIKREEKVLDICREGLASYENTLLKVEREAGKVFKRRTVKDFNFLLRVVDKLKKRMGKLESRLEEERRIIVNSAWTIDRKNAKRILSMLEQENDSIHDVIKGAKPHKLAILRTLYLGMSQNRGVRLFDYFFDKAESMKMMKSPGPPAAFMVGVLPALLGSFMVGTIDGLYKLIWGLSISDREIQAEIRAFK